MPRYACPHCQRPMEYEVQYAGTQSICPYCRNYVMLPVPSEEPPPPMITTTPATYRRRTPRRKAEWYENPSLVGIAAVIALLGVIAVLLLFQPSDAPSSPRSDAIPGLAAVDVHGNFTNKGFTLEKRLDPVQSEWRCKDENATRSMLVEAFGDSPTSLTMVHGTYIGYTSRNVDKEAADFLGYVASVPYDGSSPSEARGWVERNIGLNAKTSIGGVSFELIANAPRVRMLIISP